MISCQECGQSGGMLYPIASMQDGQIVKTYYCAEHYAAARSQASARHERKDASERIESLFGERYRSTSFDTFIADDRLRALGYSSDQIAVLADAREKAEAFTRQACKARHGSMLLTGPEGVGKTHLEVSAVRMLLEAGVSVSVRSAVNLARDIRHTYGNGIQHYRDTVKGMLDSMLSHDAVVLEDIQPICFKDDIRTHLFEIIDRIYTSRKIFIATSNFHDEELRRPEYLGPHLIDRLYEPPSLILTIRSKSYRTAMKKHSR
jgi:DNA replication protein DnaC